MGNTMTIEEAKIEIEKIIASLTASGFINVDAQMLKKLESLTAWADEQNINEGKRLMENLLNALKTLNEGEPKIESCKVRLMALDFYIKKISAVGNIEEN